MPAFPSSDFITIGSGLNVAAFYPVDYRFVFANSTDRLALSWYAAYEGLVTYQQDTQELYVLINKGPEGAPTIGQNSSWRLVGGGSGTNYAAEWAFTNTLNQSFAFTGDGLPSPEDDPTLYLLRGQSYRFSNDNTLGTHPFQIQTDLSPVINGGTPYNLGVTNNRASGSQKLIFDVPMSAPDTLYYQCTSHPAMSGSLIIVGNPGSGGSGSGFPFEGDAVITGSLLVSGSNIDFSKATALTASIISASGGITGSLKGIADTGSFIPFDGNRAISNLDLSIGGQNLAIYGENMNTNGLADFIDQVFFRNTGPVISTTGFTIQEYLPSSSVVGTVSATDPEGQSFTFGTASTYTDDFFRIDSNSGVVTMNVKSTSSMNTFNDSGTLKAPFPVVATDTGNLTGSKTLYIRVVPNTAPKWGITQNAGDLTQVTSSLSESSAIGNDKHRYYYRDDEDSNSTITINSGSFSSNFSTDFRLVNVTGITYPYVRLDQINNVDFDTYPSYSFALTASDEHFTDGDDPNSQTILPVELKILDNLPPNVGNQNLSGVREDACVGLSSTSAGTVIATDNDGTTMTVTEFALLSAYVDGVGTNVTSSLGGTSVFDASADPFIINPSTRAVTLDSGKFLNSDQANRYVYRVTIRDNFNPISSSAEVTVFVQDAPLNTLTTSTAFNIIESARTSELVKESSAGIGGNNSTSTAANSSTQNWEVNSTPDFIEATNATASSTTFQLKSNLSGSSTVGGDTITIQVTASQNNFPTSIQYFEKTVDVKLLVAPIITVTDFTDNQNTNGARPGGQNLTRLNITDGQPSPVRYDIDNSTFQFIPNAGQNLVAYRDTSVTGTTARYFVSASSNLAAGTYGYTASIENVRGFRSGEIKDSFTVIDANNGTLDVPTANIIESATNGGDVVTAAAGFGTPAQQTQLGFSFSPEYNSPSVVSITNTTAGSPIDIVGSGADIGKLSVNSNFPGNYNFGDPAITTNISFTDNYGNVGTGTFNVSVKANNPPTATLQNQTSNFNTNDATAAADMINISSITDPQGSSTYTLALSGNDASKFALSAASVSNNGTSKVQVGSNPLTAGSYEFTVRITNPFGKFTDFARTITIAQSAIYGPMYIYATSYPGTGYTTPTSYNDSMKYTNSPGNPGDATLDANAFPMTALVNNGIDQNAGLDTISLFSSNYMKQVATAIQPDNTNPSAAEALENKDSGTISMTNSLGTANRILVLIPSGSSITGIPTGGMVNSTNPSGASNKYVLYQQQGSSWVALISRINKVDFGTDTTKNKGYRYWFVIGTGTGDLSLTNGSDLILRLIPENGTAPT